MSPSQRPIASTDVVVRCIAGETLLVPVRDDVALCDNIYILNQTGSFLWSQLTGLHDVDALVELVENAFDLDSAADVRGDVLDYLREMHKRELISWSEQP